MDQKAINSLSNKFCIQQLETKITSCDIMDLWDIFVVLLGDWVAQGLTKDQITTKSLVFCAKNKMNSVDALPHIEYYTSKDDGIPHSCRTLIKKQYCSPQCNIYKYKDQDPRQ